MLPYGIRRFYEPRKNQTYIKKYLQPVASSLLLFSILNSALAETDKYEGHDHGSKAHELHEKVHVHEEPSEVQLVG